VADLRPRARAEALTRVVTLGRILIVVVALVNVGDIVLHVAIDQVEPLRIACNIVVIVAALAMLFIVTSGIGGLGAVLIALTTILLALLAGSLRRAR
jgi:hypothetical protein